MLRGGSSVGIALLATLALVCCPAATVAATEQGWSLRVDGFAMDTQGGARRAASPGTVVYVGDGDGAAGAISCEYRRSELVGIELGALAGGDFDLSIKLGPLFDDSMAYSDTVGFSAVLAGVNFHLTPGRRVDFYAGPSVAYLDYSDITLRVFDGSGPPFNFLDTHRVHLTFDSDFAIGANVGLDVPLGEGRWLFNVNTRYFDTTIEGSQFESPRNYDPLLFGLGFGYRF
jgi:hypothetical protein